MKSEWKTIRADEFCSLVTDGTHDSPKPQAAGRKLITSKHLKGYYLDFESANWISSEDYEKVIARSSVEQWDILYSMIGTIGNVYLEKNPVVDYACKNVGIFKFGGNCNKAYWMYYYLKSPQAMEFIKAHLRGTTQLYVPLATLREMPVPVPDEEEMNKIVAILRTLDDKIQCSIKINDNLHAQVKAIFSENFLNLNFLPDGWKTGNLLDIADYLNGLAMQKYHPKDGETGLPVLKIKELRQGICDASSELCSPSIKSEYIIHDGDIIFSWSGSLLVDIWCGGTCGLNQHLFKVTSNNYDKWFYYLWTAHHLDRFIAVAADKATTMGHIKREELEKAEVIIPSKCDYKRIRTLIKPLFDLIISNRIENRKLTALRNILLPKIMSGEIDVSDIQL